MPSIIGEIYELREYIADCEKKIEQVEEKILEIKDELKAVKGNDVETNKLLKKLEALEHAKSELEEGIKLARNEMRSLSAALNKPSKR